MHPSAGRSTADTQPWVEWKRIAGILAIAALGVLFWRDYQHQNRFQQLSNQHRRTIEALQKQDQEIATYLGQQFAERAPELHDVLGPLPDDLDVFAVNAAETNRRVDVQQDLFQVDVQVRHAARPVVLVLYAYRPTVWRVGRTPDTSIAAVVVMGYHRQQVFLPVGDQTTVAISSHDEPGPFPAQHLDSSWQRLLAFNQTTRQLTGHAIQRLYSQPAGPGLFYVGTQPSGEIDLMMLDDDQFAAAVQRQLVRRKP